MNSVESGFWSGVLATGPMTLFMFAAQKSLPREEQSPLPPATLTKQLTAPVADRLPSSLRQDLTMVSHFGYGIACGTLYSLLARRAPGPVAAKGAGFGLLVWAASYLGWTPALGLRAAAPKIPARRNAMMIGAHIVWGISLAFAEDKLRRFGAEMLDGKRRAPAAE